MIKSEWMEAISLLEPTTQSEVIKAIVDFNNGVEAVIEDNNAKAVWLLIRMQLVAKQKRVANGAKGGRPKKQGSAKKEIKVVEVEEHGNPEINKAIELVKSYNGGIVGDTVKKQRQYGKLLVDKLNKLKSVEEGNYTWDAVLDMILKVVSENQYHAPKLGSIESIYRNLATLMQVCKGDIQKAPKVVSIPTI